MTTNSAQPSCFNRYLSGPGSYVSDLSKWAGKVNRLLGLIFHSTDLGLKISTQQGDTRSAENCASVANSIGEGQGALNFARIIFSIEKLCTGKMFWEHKPEDGTSKWRDFLDTVQDVLVLAGQSLSSVKWLHNRGAFDLGKHAKSIGNAAGGIWTTVTSLDLVSTARDMFNLKSSAENYREKMKEKVASLACNILDLATIPFDFGCGMSIPEVSIAGSALNILSRLAHFFKEMFYYGTPDGVDMTQVMDDGLDQ